MRLPLLAAAALAAAVTLTPPDAAGTASVLVGFRTPSGNIGCLYSRSEDDPAFLRCDILSGLRPVPRGGASCELDFGHAVGMSRTGRAHGICAGDTVIDRRARVLAYGRVWRRGGFRCVSRTRGLTCTNVRGRGFFLSRERSRLF